MKKIDPYYHTVEIAGDLQIRLDQIRLDQIRLDKIILDNIDKSSKTKNKKHG